VDIGISPSLVQNTLILDTPKAYKLQRPCSVSTHGLHQPSILGRSGHLWLAVSISNKLTSVEVHPFITRRLSSHERVPS